MRLIDADKLADNMEEHSKRNKSIALLLRIIASGLRYDEAFAPTINPESLRPKGEWISHEGYEECKRCHTKAIYPHNYCPNCGADMRSHQKSLCDQNEKENDEDAELQQLYARR